MRVFLTGAGGFIGSYVAEELVGRGHTVAVLVRPDTDHWRLAGCAHAVQTIVGDLGRIDPISSQLDAFAPEVVIHAAWSGVANRHRNDQSQLANVESSTRLLTHAIRAGATHFIGFGSQAEYGLGAMRPDEWSALQPTSLYGAAKAAVFYLLKAMCEQHGVRFAWARVFSTYGPKDDAHWMIPQLILTLLRGQRPALTAGTQHWDYCHVRDAARAVAGIAEAHGACGSFNVGTGTTHTIRYIAELVRDSAAPGAPLGFGDIPFRDDQIMHLQANIDRLRRATGWQPGIPIDAGLRETVEWYRSQRGRLW